MMETEHAIRACLSLLNDTDRDELTPVERERLTVPVAQLHDLMVELRDARLVKESR